METNNKKNGLVLDLGGVVTLEQDTSCFLELGREFEVPVTLILQEMSRYRTAYDDGSLSPENYWSKVLVGLAAASPEATLKNLDADTLMERYFEWGYTADFLSWSRPRQDLHDLVLPLVAKQRRVGIISNMPKTMDGQFVQVWPWLAEAKPVLWSGVLGMAKPSPEIYRHFLESAGAGPESLLFVDDREENVRAAEAAGMKGLHFKGSKEDLAAIKAWMD